MVRTYWTMLTLDETIVDLPEKLAEKLNTDGLEKLKTEDGELLPPSRIEKHVELAKRGGINQLMVLQRNTRLVKDGEANPRKLEPGVPTLQVLDVVQSGHLMQSQQYYLGRPKSKYNEPMPGDMPEEDEENKEVRKKVDKNAVDKKEYVYDTVLQNCRGDLIHICCVARDTKEYTADRQPKYIAAKKETKLDGSTKQYMHRIEFNRDMKNTQFVYLGDFVVWKMANSQVIKYTDVSWLKENARLRSSLKITKEQYVKTKEVSLIDYVDAAHRHLVAIDAADVGQTMKQTQKTEFNDDVRIRLENYLEVTIRNRVIVFDLQLNQALPINEQGTVDMMMDPQLYVELGVQLATITDARSVLFRNHNNFQFGNVPHTQIKTIERANAGDILMFKKKSNLFLTDTYEFDIMYKPVMGIYKEHAQIDILETNALIEEGEKK